MTYKNDKMQPYLLLSFNIKEKKKSIYLSWFGF